MVGVAWQRGYGGRDMGVVGRDNGALPWRKQLSAAGSSNVWVESRVNVIV